jgi:molybdopterin-guanine dinucleotide biosynthesis protein A
MISAAILAGGKNSRMGKDKAFLSVNGKSFIEHTIDELKGFGNVLISSNDEEKFKKFGLPVVKDIYPDCGPMSGLHAVLKANGDDLVLTVPCDLPFFTSEFADKLVSSIGKYDAVIPETDDGYHPLCAVYTKNCLPVFEEALNKGLYSVSRSLKNLNVKYLQITDTEEIKNLLNINTPEEYDLYCR